MNTVRFQCDECLTTLSAPANAIGRTETCPKCAAKVVIRIQIGDSLLVKPQDKPSQPSSNESSAVEDDAFSLTNVKTFQFIAVILCTMFVAGVVFGMVFGYGQTQTIGAWLLFVFTCGLSFLGGALAIGLIGVLFLSLAEHGDYALTVGPVIKLLSGFWLGRRLLIAGSYLVDVLSFLFYGWAAIVFAFGVTFASVIFIVFYIRARVRHVEIEINQIGATIITFLVLGVFIFAMFQALTATNEAVRAGRKKRSEFRERLRVTDNKK